MRTATITIQANNIQCHKCHKIAEMECQGVEEAIAWLQDGMNFFMGIDGEHVVCEKCRRVFLSQRHELIEKFEKEFFNEQASNE